jgi:hypothetical protein
MESWQNGKLAKWKVGEMESWQNGKLAEWKVGKMKSWQNGKLAKWKVGEMESWQNGELAKYVSAPIKCFKIKHFDTFLQPTRNRFVKLHSHWRRFAAEIASGSDSGRSYLGSLEEAATVSRRSHISWSKTFVRKTFSRHTKYKKGLGDHVKGS